MNIGQQFYHAIENTQLQKQGLPFNNLLTLLQYELVYQLALDYLKPEMKVLDWGCGNGHFSYFLTQQKVNTVSYSIEERPNILQENESYTHRQGLLNDPVNLPFDEHCFDVVFSIGVLEHVFERGGDEQLSLNEISRILKPGGYFMCFHFPNKYQWVGPFNKLFRKNAHYHRRCYALGDIKQLIPQNMTLETWGRYNFLPRNQLASLPSWLTKNRIFVGMYQGMDTVMTALFPFFCTNYYFILHKKTP